MKPAEPFLTRLTEKFASFFRSLGSYLGKLFDKIVYSNKASLVVTGLFALIFCVAINFDQLRFTFLDQDVTTLNLNNIPIEVLMDTENYEVSNLPSTADLNLEGDESDIQLVRTQNSASIVADLRSFTEGPNVVILKPTGLPTGLNVEVNPSSVEVSLARKYTRSFQITPDVLPAAGRQISDYKITMSEKYVTVKATNAKLNDIRSVKAIIDASRNSTDFTVQASLVAYDASGKQMNVSISPDTVQVKVTLQTTGTTAGSPSTTSSGEIAEGSSVENELESASLILPALEQPEEAEQE